MAYSLNESSYCIFSVFELTYCLWYNIQTCMLFDHYFLTYSFPILNQRDSNMQKINSLCFHSIVIRLQAGDTLSLIAYNVRIQLFLSYGKRITNPFVYIYSIQKHLFYG